MSLVDRRVAGLVLVLALPRGIRKRRVELAQVGGDLVAPGDRALVGRLSDRVLSVKRFEASESPFTAASVSRSMTSRAFPMSASPRPTGTSYARTPRR